MGGIQLRSKFELMNVSAALWPRPYGSTLHRNANCWAAVTAIQELRQHTSHLNCSPRRSIAKCGGHAEFVHTKLKLNIYYVKTRKRCQKFKRFERHQPTSLSRRHLATGIARACSAHGLKHTHTHTSQVTVTAEHKSHLRRARIIACTPFVRNTNNNDIIDMEIIITKYNMANNSRISLNMASKVAHARAASCVFHCEVAFLFRDNHANSTQSQPKNLNLT